MDTGEIIFNEPKKRLAKLWEEEEKLQGEDKNQPSGEEQEKLGRLVGKSEKFLFRASSIFPFDLFPDEIVIDLSKIDIIYRDILGSYSTHSIPVGDVVDVSVEAIPFFATLKVVDKRYMESQEFAIRFLKREEANQAKRIIQGLISAKEEGVDLSKVIDEGLIKKLEELGDVETKF